MARETILIVDDEVLIRRQAEAALKHSGYHTLIAANGYDALQLIEKENLDLMLSDIRMPDLDGLQLFSQARKIQPEIIGVFMTAHGSIDNVVKAMQAGVSSFLLKPFTGHELERAIVDAFQKHRTTQEAARMRLLGPLFEARRLLSTELDLATLLQSLVEVVVTETGSDYCAVFLTDPTLAPEDEKSEGALKLAASFAGPGARAFSPRTFPAASLAARTYNLGRTLSLRRASGTEPLMDGEVVPGAIIGVPFTAGPEILGAMLVGRADLDHHFTGSEREVFELIAAQIGNLLENQRRQTLLTERTQRLQVFASHFLQIQEEERKKLVDRIQADLLPNLTSTRKSVQAYLQKVRPTSAGELLQVEERLHSLVNSAKKLINELHPSNLDEFGLSAALRQYVHDLQESPALKNRLSFRLQGEEVPRLGQEVEVAMFRAAQDALNNALSHSKSAPVSLTVQVSGPANRPDLVELEVLDSGPGFKPPGVETDHPSAGLGLLAIQERVRLVEATCSITSDPTGGTLVTISYRLPKDYWDNLNGIITA